MDHSLLSPRARTLRAAAATLVCAALLIPPSMPASAAPALSLDISKFAFAPKEITVAPGTRVVWTNRDEAPHTVAGKDKSFTSKGLDTADKFDHTFEAEGDFEYYCTLHPFMTGVVHVRKP
jgi:plastocyanin